MRHIVIIYFRYDARKVRHIVIIYFRVNFHVGALEFVMGLLSAMFYAHKRYIQSGAHGQKQNGPWAPVEVQMGGGTRI